MLDKVLEGIAVHENGLGNVYLFGLEVAAGIDMPLRVALGERIGSACFQASIPGCNGSPNNLVWIHLCHEHRGKREYNSPDSHRRSEVYGRSCISGVVKEA